MEYHLTKKSLSRRRDVLHTVAEQPVDFELTLPDYCPDIERILSCVLIPKIYLSNVSGDRLSVEGGSCVRVMYVDGDKGTVRSYEYSKPFSESLPLGESVSDCALYVEAKPEYINCRALSPRKLSLHGAFSLCASVAAVGHSEFCACESQEELQMKGEVLEASSLCGLCTESFNLQEDIPADTKDGISALLSHRLSASITELKSIHNKIMLSGELKLDILCLSDGEQRELRCLSYSLPISRVIDCEGAREDAVIDGDLTVMSGEVHLGGDALDGSGVLSLDARLSFSAMCYLSEEIEVLSDAFATDREVDVRIAPFSCCGDMICRSFTEIGKATLQIDDKIGRVHDVHCEKCTVSFNETDSGVLISAKLCVEVLYEDQAGELKCVRRDAEFSCRPDTADRDTVERLRASVTSLSYRLTDGSGLEIRAEICYRLTLCKRLSCSAVASICADDEAPLRGCEGSLVLYYADGDDSVWDISKRFSSRPADIRSENALEGDTVGKGMMLLIPSA